VTFQDKRVEFGLKWLLAAEPELPPCLAPIGFRCNADDTPRFAPAGRPFEASAAFVGWQFDRLLSVRTAGPRDMRFADWARGLRLRAAHARDLRQRESEAHWLRRRPDQQAPADRGRAW